MIKEYRKKMNYTQEQLAEIIDISTRQLQRIEVNEDRTKISTMRNLINILQIPDNEILKYMKRKLVIRRMFKKQGLHTLLKNHN